MVQSLCEERFYQEWIFCEERFYQEWSFLKSLAWTVSGCKLKHASVLGQYQSIWVDHEEVF